MPYLSLTLDQARKLVTAGELNAESIMGMEGWPGDAKLEIFVHPKPEPVEPSAPAMIPPAPVVTTPPTPPTPPAPMKSAKVNQEKGSEPAPAPTAAPAEPAAVPGTSS